MRQQNGNLIELLVSVRDPSEALAALDGGADVIDVKDPDRGPLGRADWSVISQVVRTVTAARPSTFVSAALGDVLDWTPDTPGPDRNFRSPTLFKIGLAGVRDVAPVAPWTDAWQELLTQVEGLLPPQPSGPPDRAAVAYADFELCGAPSPAEVLRAAHDTGCPVLLLDTWRKDGSSLLDWISGHALHELRFHSEQYGIRLALAGQITDRIVDQVLDFNPDIVAVRGAVCESGDRRSTVSAELVRRFAKRLDGRHGNLSPNLHSRIHHVTQSRSIVSGDHVKP